MTARRDKRWTRCDIAWMDVNANSRRRGVFCTIVPPHVLDKLSQHEDSALADPARRTLERDALERTRRRITTVRGIAAPPGGRALRPAAAHDLRLRHRHATCPAAGPRRGRGPRPRTRPVDQAYDGLGATFDLYWNVYRPQLDRRRRAAAGRRPCTTASDYDNAFWNGAQMVFGDGDGELFTGFTNSRRRHRPRADPRRHPVHRRASPTTASPGALNESISDVFGSLVKQYALGQTAAQADWLIGAGLLRRGVNGVALRSMKAPGHGVRRPVLGKDPQPAHMERLRRHRPTTTAACTSTPASRTTRSTSPPSAIGGNAWEEAGQIWYDVLTGGELPGPRPSPTSPASRWRRRRARYGDGGERVPRRAGGLGGRRDHRPGRALILTLGTEGPMRISVRRTGGFAGHRAAGRAGHRRTARRHPVAALAHQAVESAAPSPRAASRTASITRSRWTAGPSTPRTPTSASPSASWYGRS